MWDSVFGTLRKNRDSVFLNKKIPRCARDSGEGKVDVMDSNKSPRCARETLSRLKTKHCPRMTLCLQGTRAGQGLQGTGGSSALPAASPKEAPGRAEEGANATSPIAGAPSHPVGQEQYRLQGSAFKRRPVPGCMRHTTLPQQLPRLVRYP